MRLDLEDGRDEHIGVRLSDVIELALLTPGASGYHWEAEVDPDRLRIRSRQRIANEVGFGGSGSTVFTLDPLKSGNSVVTLRLIAPWESSPARQHTITVDVTEDADARRKQ